ncbi:MAG: thiamine phosphate synthase [Neisseria sp.]|nr:thiamine phosphate synthase [Neisseria sp.]
MNPVANMLNVYFIAGTQDFRHVDGDRSRALLDCLERALQQGISCFQLREKGGQALQDKAQIEALALACRDLCRRHQVPFFINDDVALALQTDADGVHVGQEDMPVQDAVALCRGRLMLGLSVNTLAQAQHFDGMAGIDYFGVGPVFATRSKADAKAVAGPALLAQIRAAGIRKPLVGIGGIHGGNADQVYQAGADGVAVISAIAQAADMAAAIRQLKGKS